VDALDESIACLSQEIAERLRPFEAELTRLQTIPGVGRRGAEVLLAEISSDMTRFSTANHLASWAGMCPGKYESVGKCQKGTTRKGSPWLRAIVAEAAWAASHTKATRYAVFERLDSTGFEAARQLLGGICSHPRSACFETLNDRAPHQQR
jgi:transposase